MKVKGKRKIISGALLCTMCAYTMPVMAFTKEETVYSKLTKEGENYSTLVSTHLENEEEADVLKDMTDLLNIENTKGEEEILWFGKLIKRIFTIKEKVKKSCQLRVM